MTLALAGTRMDRSDPVKEFEALVLEHLDGMHAVARRLTREQALAEDLVHDTVLRALKNRTKFELGTNLKAWLLRILTNIFINGYRRGGLERNTVQNAHAAGDPVADGWISAASMRGMRDSEEEALRPVLRSELSRAVDELPDDFRIALVLCDVEDLSYKEIAEVMGTPVGTVMSRIFRARKILQGRLHNHAVAAGIISEDDVRGDNVVSMQRFRPVAGIDGGKR